MSDRRRTGIRGIAALTVLGVFGAVALLTPAFAHPGSPAHVYDHVKTLRKRLRTAGTINASRNPVNWTKLAGVPDTIADGFDQPAIFQGLKNGPLDLPGGGVTAAGSTIGTLTLPAGSYAIFAKAYFVKTGGGTQLVECVLEAGGDSDKSATEVAGDPADATVALQAVHTFAAAGTAVVKCTDNDGAGTDVTYNYLKIAAIGGSSLSSVAA